MKTPKFKSDEEMAAWFEAHDVSAEDLEVADDVTVSRELSVMPNGLYSVSGAVIGPVMTNTTTTDTRCASR